MIPSKSFGYALRSVLYVALMNEKKKRVRVEEVARELSVPKHFLGKIMNRLVKEGLLRSTKGPYGGFSITEDTLSAPLTRLVNIADGMEQFNTCVLRLRACDARQPCPLHHHIQESRNELIRIFSETRVEDLLSNDKIGLVKSISTL